MTEPNITIPEETQAQSFQTKNFLHYDGERIDYAISNSELDELGQVSNNIWKDFCLTCIGVGIPCSINAISIVSKSVANFSPTLAFNLNALFGIIGIVLGLAFGIAWSKNKNSTKKIVDRIKEKPKIELH